MMAPRAGQVAQIMLRDPDQSLADQAIVRIRLLRCQSIRTFAPRARATRCWPLAGVKEPQAPERAQLILGVIKALRNLKGLCPGRADLGNGTSGIHQRCRKRGVELHLAARVPARSGRDSGERLLDPAAALLQQ